jgi:DNA-binding FadR family transcriptional regulator
MEIQTYKKVKNLQSFVQEQLKLYIVESNLECGDLLPTEKELSIKLGVSRTAIRESLKVLETLGIIETKHGVGRFVKDFNYDSILENLPYNLKLDTNAFRDILEVRLCLESWFIAKDINKYTSSDINELKELLGNMKEQIRDNVEEEKLVSMHSKFHTLLYKNSQNKLLIDLIRMFSTIQRNLVLKHRYKTKDRFQFVKLHNMIVKAIEAKDPYLVQKMLRKHFAEAIKWVQDNSKEEKNIDILKGFWFKRIENTIGESIVK